MMSLKFSRFAVVLWYFWFSSAIIALWTIGSPLTFVDAVSECVATGVEMTSFQCFASAKADLKCEDTDNRCPQWAGNGECKSNPQYMLLWCRKSCESCISGHAGEVQVAPDPKTRDRVIQLIKDTQQYLKEQSEFKAKILRTCRNENQMCAYFAILGECTKNQAYMHDKCAAACKTCK
jgi:ShK domain-like